MSLLKIISDTVWCEKFWLPPNISWSDIEPGRNGINHADYRHLIYPIPMSFLIILLRMFVEKFFIVPIGLSLQIKPQTRLSPRPNKYLEAAYRIKSKLTHAMTLQLTKQLDLSEREVQRWWRTRKALDTPTALQKFCESGWKFLMYSFVFVYGLCVLWDKPYFWSLYLCAEFYPHHEVTNDVWWYYMISMAFHWSLTFTQFFERKRKDFWQMFTHHMCTVLLTSFAWICNIHRVACMIIVVHYCADVFLELAKTLNYAKIARACDAVFGFFTIVWIISRLMIFPRIIYACMFQTYQPSFPAYFYFNFLLVGLLIMHIIWTHAIFQVIAKSIQTGGVQGDVRSSSDEIGDSCDDNNNQALKK